MCHDYRRLLLYIAGRKFRVPEPDAEALVQEALLAFLTTTGEICNPRAWLVATMCNASRNYWRQRARIERVEGTTLMDAAEVAVDLSADRLERELVVSKVLSLLTPRDRAVLRLHYFEQLTAAVIGKLLSTTTRYAEKRIYKALKRARGIYARLHALRVTPRDETGTDTPENAAGRCR